MAQRLRSEGGIGHGAAPITSTVDRPSPHTTSQWDNFVNQCICTDCLLAFALVQHGKIVAQDTVFYQVVGERRTSEDSNRPYAPWRPSEPVYTGAVRLYSS